MEHPLTLSTIFINLLIASTDALTIAKRQAPATNLPDQWSYAGCYSDSTASRSLRSAAPVGDMSAQKCITYCNTRGYKFAGTEYSNECFCGNTIQAPGAEVDSGCSMECSGAPGEACGGPGRLSVYQKDPVTGGGGTPPAPSAPEGWGARGCYSDNGGARILNVIGTVEGGPSKMSPETCTAGCKNGDFKYAGVEYGGECFCGNELLNGHGPEEGCDMPCNGDATQTCGGPNRINIFEFGLKAAAPEPPKGWQAQGCYVDSVGTRTLGVGMGVTGAMTNDKCQTACRNAGYTWAGTEYSAECFCDSALRNGGGPAPDGNDQCSMLCAGDETQMCGGPNRLTMFRFFEGNEGSTTSATTGPTPTPTEDTPTSTRVNTASATATGLPEGWEYKGCYVDGPGFRIMGNAQADNPQLTIASCSKTCDDLGFTIAGMEYSYQCFCDNVIRQDGKLATDDSQCGMPCSGASGEKCGGPDRLSVWSSQDVLKVVRPPKAIEKVGNWVYQACIDEPTPLQARVFPWQLVNKTGNSPEWCLGKCAEFGYMAGGMQFGEECYCGDIDGVEAVNAKEVPESECSVPCPGNPEALCGAGLRYSWYKYVDEENPLYVFDYPSGPAAGGYEFLIGGPVIPLISQPAINGKVSLLEKKGTGPPNSTGAYEFDPSLGDDIFKGPFREMYGIKTDIFCAAGLTMPDKGGRQINIGGWSADSTFGVRIYTPDGELGTNGTNDWQENVNEVALQSGRWYPTGMVMANGSMLIVGGQSGSNGSPVPTMEILPRAGPVKFQQYLQDTDPFNLYPFLAVMPSGAIFIQYYNQARLIDEKSLDTVKILPQVPASVNNPRGGRTYPYEGTQVLLPQYAPYSDPLEVLICGGAVPNPQWGIDNCVSIAPDADEPKWTIERMPSRRVISCMVTLPDGTFLILNGGKNGEAGFQLGKNANLNAVLYDSRKPLHRRMSVMANTTIPRMYHSEAVLLDDGRILVSGSDPQDKPDFEQEYRIEVFLPPYILSGAPKPAFTLANSDWAWSTGYAFTLTASSGGPIRVSLLGSESSTHGNSMGARILFPEVACAGNNTCTVLAPPGPYVAPVGWYRMFVLDGDMPSHAKWVRIGGDPAGLGNWPDSPSFQPLPGV
ncbi:glyoxal oxidase N-terminus-domain-containing protein [Massariosphaeria phaeospora]|uniref:Glyoxal oxidase N-terminus-domain-containing protein n=1 Tax=Massariosphaeria phaeospora TaxID=100035 RepID=A0A7C8M1K7_9PLEO|nr:glyoxal oxidase N-terminus-domain-containing protein [Massariosphaeria phaeospora]